MIGWEGHTLTDAKFDARVAGPAIPSRAGLLCVHRIKEFAVIL